MINEFCTKYSYTMTLNLLVKINKNRFLPSLMVHKIQLKLPNWTIELKKCRIFQIILIPTNKCMHVYIKDALFHDEKNSYQEIQNNMHTCICLDHQHHYHYHIRQWEKGFIYRIIIVVLFRSSIIIKKEGIKNINQKLNFSESF